MAVHQCPKCELRFTLVAELDDHCEHDHPAFRHEDPADAGGAGAVTAPLHQAPQRRGMVEEVLRWLSPTRPAEQPMPRSRVAGVPARPGSASTSS